jgi:hypothetical protein
MRRLATIGVGVLGLLGVLGAPHASEACMMVSNGPPPKLTGEKVLLVYDEDKGLEHFIREIKVDQGVTDFGFVVPTPSKPEVAKAPNVFDALEQHFPVLPPGGGTVGGPRGSKGLQAAAAAPVEVVAQVQVGSFIATTLRASETTALEKWLTDNKFKADKIGRAWLEHYVLRNAYFVAFKFNGQKSAGQGMRSEAVRLSFSVPRPYYPYFEPPSGTQGSSTRQLGVWFVASSTYVPRSYAVSERGPQLVSPWYEVGKRRDASDPIRNAVGAELGKLLPTGPLVIQVFLDQKRERPGLGDVVMIREEPKSVPGDEERLKALLPFWDPLLVPNSPVLSEAP